MAAGRADLLVEDGGDAQQLAEGWRPWVFQRPTRGSGGATLRTETAARRLPQVRQQALDGTQWSRVGAWLCGCESLVDLGRLGKFVRAGRQAALAAGNLAARMRPSPP